MQGRSTPYEIYEMAWPREYGLSCYVGYMTNDEECHGVVISLFVV